MTTKRGAKPMFSKLQLVCDPESPYGCQEYGEECGEKCRCFVPFDRSERDDRCCTFSRISGDRYDWCDAGFEGEDEEMNEKEYEIHRIKRYLRWGFKIQIGLWLIIGLLALIYPQHVMLSVVIDADYRHQYDIDTHAQLRLEEEYVHDKQKYDSISPSVGSIFASLFSKFYASDQTTPEDKQALTRQLDQLTTELAKHAQKTAMTGPTQVYGACALFFAYMSFVTLFYQLREATELDTSLVTSSIAWYAFNFVGFAVSAAGRGEGIGSSSFLFFMLAGCFVYGAFWFFMRENIFFSMPRKRRSSAYHDTEDYQLPRKPPTDATEAVGPLHARKPPVLTPPNQGVASQSDL